MTSKLAQIQARFQQKQLQEREEKLLKLYESQQQRAFERVGRGSAGSQPALPTAGGKVRQMFDERRQRAGVDRGCPLEPLKPKARGASLDRKAAGATVAGTRSTVVRSTVQKSVTAVRNGKLAAQKRQVVRSLYENNNGRESYEERRFEDDGDDLVDMMNGNNLGGSLDDEVMPKIGFDELDNYEEVVGAGTDDGAEMHGQKKNVISNGYAPVYRKEQPLTKKTSTSTVNARTSPIQTRTPPVQTRTPPIQTRTPPIQTRTPPIQTRAPPIPTRTPPTQTRTSASPRNNEKTVSRASSRSSSGSTAMGDKGKSPAASSRAPTATRPSAKQSPRSAVTRDDLTECGYCGRRFASDRIQKHEEVCAKTGKKKRKVYDATKHRVVGTELESYVLKGGKGKPSQMTNKSSKQSAKKDWRRTHEEFIAAIRAAKEAQAHLAKGGKLSDLPPPPPSSNPDYVQCPHCGRRFNESAAERHIPKCADFQFNKPKPKQGKPPRR